MKNFVAMAYGYYSFEEVREFEAADMDVAEAYVRDKLWDCVRKGQVDLYEVADARTIKSR